MTKLYYILIFIVPEPDFFAYIGLILIVSEIAIAPTITSQQDLKLKGIRIVYIQYRSNKTKAEAIQIALQDEGIAAPGIEKINGIKENSIRYANSSDRSLAENLRNFLKSKTGIQIEENLIDLSISKYKVPSGQLEVWLKD